MRAHGIRHDTGGTARDRSQRVYGEYKAGRATSKDVIATYSATSREKARAIARKKRGAVQANAARRRKAKTRTASKRRRR